MTSREPKAERLSRLADEIGFALGRGEFPENTLREFRFLWRTTPDQEKEGYSVNLKDIEEMVKDMRREDTTAKLIRIPVEHVANNYGL